jgi:8-oxo-dGTP pyrophosphatase MutT (NUDIX family)
MRCLREFVRHVLNENEGKRAAIVYIVNDDGLVLSVSRKDDETQIGLPGGKVDVPETPYQAAKRELEEETGLKASNLKLAFVAGDSTGYEVYAFTAGVKGTIETDEVGALKWVTHEQLLDPDVSPYHEYNSRLFKQLNVC